MAYSQSAFFCKFKVRELFNFYTFNSFILLKMSSIIGLYTCWKPSSLLVILSQNRNLDRSPEGRIGSFPMFLVVNSPWGIFGIIRLQGAASNYWRVKNSPPLTEACCGIYLKHVFMLMVKGNKKKGKKLHYRRWEVRQSHTHVWVRKLIQQW